MSDPLTIIHGDALSSLRTLESESVQTCVTSPPYWGLRDYGHEWQIGLEKTPEEYVARLVEVFSEVKRVLRKDGTLWLNLGDSYFGDSPSRSASSEAFSRTWNPADSAGNGGLRRSAARLNGFKPKSLCMLPARVAIALQDGGWYLRSEIAWCKRAPMPESVTDRPTSATEKIFLLSKSKTYFYNNEAVRERYSDATYLRLNQSTFDSQKGGDKDPLSGNRSARKSLENLKARVDKQRGHSRRHAGFNDRWNLMTKEEQCSGGSNLRNYWVLGPETFPDAHFAVFPTEIPRRCILLGSNAADAVLDPFAGSGTTGKVAIELGRRAILIEPKAEYIEMMQRRCQTTIGLPLAI